MLIRNEATGRLVDNNLNENGERRMSISQCYDIAHDLNRAMTDATIWEENYNRAAESRRDAMKRYDDLYESAADFVKWLGDNARTHAIDNELCANYERFLSGTLGEYVKDNDDVNIDKAALARTFVISASRARMLTVKTYNIVRQVGRYVDRARAFRDANNQSTWDRETEVIEETPISNYEECQERNESFARRGDYSTRAERGEPVRYDETDDGQPDERPQYPRGGQRWTNPDNGVTFEWCSGCGQWEEV